MLIKNDMNCMSQYSTNKIRISFDFIQKSRTNMLMFGVCIVHKFNTNHQP